MENYIIIAVVAAAVSLAVRYIYRQKKRGAKCIGCSAACCCSTQGGCCSCGKTE